MYQLAVSKHHLLETCCCKWQPALEAVVDQHVATSLQRRTAKKQKEKYQGILMLSLDVKLQVDEY